MRPRFSPLSGCVLEPLDGAACRALLDWTRGAAARPPGVDPSIRWLLAHGWHGVTWGVTADGGGRWRLGCEAAPEISPPLSEQTLLDLRLFGDRAEILVWSSERGLAGRVMCDTEERWPEDDPLRPSTEQRLLLGDRVRKTLDPPFTLIAEGGGARQVVPVVVRPSDFDGGARRLLLEVRHYWQRDEETGVVRIGASRLAGVTMTRKGRHG